MSGKSDDVKKGGPVVDETRRGVRVAIVAGKPVKAGGAKGGRKMNAQKYGTNGRTEGISANDG